MTEKLPVSASPTQKARTQDIDLLEADARRALTADRPATDALWTALLKPRDVVLRKYRETMARMTTEATAPGMDLVDPTGRAMGDGPAALIAIAETMVAKAILGDASAAGEVFTRIEGSAAKRKGDAGDDNERAELIGSIEELVRDMHARAAKRPGDDALDITQQPNGRDKPNGHA